jgi:hypothetical protein
MLNRSMLCLSVRWDPRPAPRVCTKEILHEGQCEASLPLPDNPQMWLRLMWERSVVETVADRQRLANA